jgi:hypothetical protein
MGRLTGRKPHHLGLLAIALVTVVLGVAPPVTASAAAAAVGRPVVRRVPASPPRLPYIDVAAARIRDGSRAVSIAGLVGSPVALYKVQGGYVVRRLVGAAHQLVLVTDAGARRVLVDRIESNSPVVVASQGGRIAYDPGSTESYRTVEVRTVPTGKVVSRRVFTEPAVPLAYRSRLLLRLGDGRVLWWRPTVFHTEQIRSHFLAQVADLTALQMAAPNAVESIAPRTSPGWQVGSAPVIFRAWSTDDRFLAGDEDPDPDGADPGSLVVVDASDGTRVTSPSLGPWTGEVVWEDASHLLVSRIVGGAYVLHRCTIPGSACEQVGTGSPSRYGGYVLATRRTS